MKKLFTLLTLCFALSTHAQFAVSTTSNGVLTANAVAPRSTNFFDANILRLLTALSNSPTARLYIVDYSTNGAEVFIPRKKGTNWFLEKSFFNAPTVTNATGTFQHPLMFSTGNLATSPKITNSPGGFPLLVFDHSDTSGESVIAFNFMGTNHWIVEAGTDFFDIYDGEGDYVMSVMPDALHLGGITRAVSVANSLTANQSILTNVTAAHLSSHHSVGIGYYAGIVSSNNIVQLSTNPITVLSLAGGAGANGPGASIDGFRLTRNGTDQYPVVTIQNDTDYPVTLTTLSGFETQSTNRLYIPGFSSLVLPNTGSATFFHNGGLWYLLNNSPQAQGVLAGENSAPANLTVRGANLWSDGTNLCFVLQNSAGVRTTNKITGVAAWP